MAHLDETNYLKVDDYTILLASANAKEGGKHHGDEAVKCLACILTFYRMGYTFISSKQGDFNYEDNSLTESGIKKQEYINNSIFIEEMKADGRYIVRLRVDEVFEMTGRSLNSENYRKEEASDILIKIMSSALARIITKDGREIPVSFITAGTIKNNFVYFYLNREVVDLIIDSAQYKNCNLMNLFELKTRFACTLYLFLGRYQDLFNTSREYLIPRDAGIVYKKLGISLKSRNKTHQLDNAINEINEKLNLGLTVDKIGSNPDKPNSPIKQLIFHVEHPEILKPEDNK